MSRIKQLIRTKWLVSRHEICNNKSQVAVESHVQSFWSKRQILYARRYVATKAWRINAPNSWRAPTHITFLSQYAIPTASIAHPHITFTSQLTSLVVEIHLGILVPARKPKMYVIRYICLTQNTPKIKCFCGRGFTLDQLPGPPSWTWGGKGALPWTPLEKLTALPGPPTWTWQGRG